MSGGSWMDDGKDTIGNKPEPHGRLGEVPARLAQVRGRVRPARTPSHKLGPMEFNTKQAQGVFVILPKKTVTADDRHPVRGHQVLLQRHR